MPIYEFACPKCKVLYHFLSKRIQTDRSPVCPKCGHADLEKAISSFSMIKGSEAQHPMPPEGVSDTEVFRTMQQIEKDMVHMDESNPRHMASMLRKMQASMPDAALPKDWDVALSRMEAGENPDNIEADMGELLSQSIRALASDPSASPQTSYRKDPHLYDF